MGMAENKVEGLSSPPKQECLVDALKRIAEQYKLETHDSLILYRLSSAISQADRATE